LKVAKGRILAGALLLAAAACAFAVPALLVRSQPRTQAERPPASFSVGPAPATVVRVSPSLVKTRRSPSVLASVKHAHGGSLLTIPRRRVTVSRNLPKSSFHVQPKAPAPHPARKPATPVTRATPQPAPAVVATGGVPAAQPVVEKRTTAAAATGGDASSPSQSRKTDQTVRPRRRDTTPTPTTPTSTTPTPPPTGSGSSPGSTPPPTKHDHEGDGEGHGNSDHPSGADGPSKHSAVQSTPQGGGDCAEDDDD
jgi:hypothetical protein